jgi:hypothetical protein
MEIVIEIFRASVDILREASVYVLLGFLMAGILRATVKTELVARYFSAGRFRSVLYASLLGVPIPL